MTTVSLILPMPPSVNRIWRNAGKRVIKSPEYDKWILRSGFALIAQNPREIEGWYSLKIFVPAKMRGDIDNRIKAISDLLVNHGIVEDDKMAWNVHISRCKNVEKDSVQIIVHPYTATDLSVGDVVQSVTMKTPHSDAEAA